MADELADGEFWLPSQFLTDDDILMDFKSDDFGSGFGSSSISDLGSLTTETETSSDDDELLVPSGKVLGSPQSTLCGWDHGSPTGPVSPEKEQEQEPLKVDNGGDVATLDLLNRAAGEVAKMKLRTEMKSSSTGTGFFDCSNSVKGLFSPPQQQQRPPQPPVYPHQFYAHPHFRRFPPHLMWIPPPQPQPQPLPLPQVHNRATKNCPTTNNGKNNNRPLGLPPSAWPPLPGQAQHQPKTQAQSQSQTQGQPMMPMYVAPQNVSVGTGVFLPRRVSPAAPEPKKKSDGNATKSKYNKASQRRNSRPAKSNDDYEIQLPSEWVY